MNVAELKKKLLRRVETQSLEFSRRTMHLLERPLPSGTVLQIGPNRHEVVKEAFLVVIDEDPGAYWLHPVRYELHDTATGEVRVIQEQHPLESPAVTAELTPLHVPDLPSLKKREQEGFFNESPDVRDIEKLWGTSSYGAPRAQASRRHALFIAGMNNMDDFHNDFVLMHNVLVNRYGYDPANIVIVLGDGTSYPDLPVDHAGDQAGIDAALDAFATGGTHALTASDTLFLYTFNHGGNDGTNSYLCLLGWNSYYDYQLRAKLDNIHCGELIVAMNQCHSGGFIDDVTATTGPGKVAIMTTCSADQTGHPASGLAHGYFSVALATALNWEFPAGIGASFPGYTAGSVTTQDSNNDGLVSAEEAFDYVNALMAAHHDSTINGNETPQWGVSETGAGADMYWGLPDIVVADGNPWWESPDIFLMEPLTTPDDATAVPGNPANWGDDYHPDTINRIVARVHNQGCAPARNISVEFRVMSFGIGGGTTVVGIKPLPEIEPGHHAYAFADWNFPSALQHRCTMVRATCAGDPASAFGTSIAGDDNQAQRNLDPVYAAPGLAVPLALRRQFRLQNPLREKVEFVIEPANSRFQSQQIRLRQEEFEKLRHGQLGPLEQKTVTIQFDVSDEAKLGEKLHVPLEIRSVSPQAKVLGGVTFMVEIAAGHLEGGLFVRRQVVPRGGTVTIRNVKQPDLVYTAKVTSRGTFSFPGITPGPYHIEADCGTMTGTGSVFVQANRVTSKVMLLKKRIAAVRVIRKEAAAA